VTQFVSAERAAALRNKCLNLAKTRRSGSGSASERTSQSRQLMSPSLAHFGHFDRAERCLILGVKRTSRLRAAMLQKSFWGDERKFLEPLMRFTRGDVRDHTVLSKIDHGPPFWR